MTDETENQAGSAVREASFSAHSAGGLCWGRREKEV